MAVLDSTLFYKKISSPRRSDR